MGVTPSIGARSVAVNPNARGGDGARRIPEAALVGVSLAPFIVLCAVLADRAQIGLATGGRGALPILAVAAPVIAWLAILRYGQARTLRFVTHPAFLLGVVPYLALTAVLPVLGVMFNGYPERTLLSTTDATPPSPSSSSVPRWQDIRVCSASG